MKTELVQTLTSTFEASAQQTEGSVEYWLARDLQHLLGYDEWRNFTAVIIKAKTACEVSGHSVRDHFVDVNKTIQMPKSAEKEIPDLMLTRYACYLIAQNGDPKKQEIAFALIRSKGDQAIFGKTTQAMYESRFPAPACGGRRLRSTALNNARDPSGPASFARLPNQGRRVAFGFKAQWKVLDNRPLADFVPTIILKAKDFATEITIFNARQHGMKSETAISHEHITNNQAVRKTLLERGIRPESLPVAEDVKKVERRFASEEKKSLKRPDALPPEEKS